MSTLLGIANIFAGLGCLLIAVAVSAYNGDVKLNPGPATTFFIAVAILCLVSGVSNFLQPWKRKPARNAEGTTTTSDGQIKSEKSD